MIRAAALRARWWLPALLLSACASIDEGTQISEIAAPEGEPPPESIPVVKSDQVPASALLALQNYEKLLKLPQDAESRAETMRRLGDLNLQLDEQAGGSAGQDPHQPAPPTNGAIRTPACDAW